MSYSKKKKNNNNIFALKLVFFQCNFVKDFLGRLQTFEEIRSEPERNGRSKRVEKKGRVPPPRHNRKNQKCLKERK
jgi:hypothetical protein